MAELQHKNKYYTVKRLRMLEYLMNKGFEPLHTMPDPSNPKYHWWKFENTVELEEAVTEYFNSKKSQSPIT